MAEGCVQVQGPLKCGLRGQGRAVTDPLNTPGGGEGHGGAPQGLEVGGGEVE